MEYIIEKIPLPQGRKAGGISDAMRQLRIGESFEIPNPKQKGLHTIARQLGIRIATRKTDVGVRVWRIDDEDIAFISGNQITIEPVDEVPMTRQEKLDNLRAMIADPAPFLAQPEPIADDWHFTKDKPNYPDDGRAYRQQILYPAGKRFRTVEVDIDNIETIIRVC